MGAVYARTVSDAPDHLIDHVAYLGTVERMRAGAGYYSAFRDAYLQDVNIRMGRPRAFREPTVFLLWRIIPTTWLFGLFVVIVAITAVLLAKASVRPVVALAPALYLIVASRTTVTEWMHVEFWALPLLAGALLAWQRQRWWLSAALGGGAVLVRETAVPFLVAGLVVAVAQKKPWKPWLVALTTSAILVGAHYALASRYTLPQGTDEPVLGTARIPYSTLDMLTWPFQHQMLIGILLIALWAAAIYELATRRTMLLTTGLLLIPLLGFVTDRGYWALVSLPFVVWLGADGLAELASRIRPQ
jgi:hypothetical protein